jgi:hypothetical protein
LTGRFPGPGGGLRDSESETRGSPGPGPAGLGNLNIGAKAAEPVTPMPVMPPAMMTRMIMASSDPRHHDMMLSS